MLNPHQATKDFERALSDYTGAPYAVAVTSCTMALLLAVKWHIRDTRKRYTAILKPGDEVDGIRFIGPQQQIRVTVDPPAALCQIEIPKRTYVSVPMSIVHAGGWPTFRDEDWLGGYQLKPLPVYDYARRFTSGMYRAGQMQCLSFHTSKILGDSQAGAILHDDPAADIWLRKARFDGRTEGVAPADDSFDMMGWHCYLSPDVAARLLWKLSVLPKHNADLPNSDYPDLSTMEVFK